MGYREKDPEMYARRLEEENERLREGRWSITDKLSVALVAAICACLLGAVAGGVSSCEKSTTACNIACARERGFCGFETPREYVCGLRGDDGHERERFVIPRRGAGETRQ